MKVSYFIITVLIAALVCLGISHSGKSNDAHASAESVADRVVRTGVIHCGYFSWPPYVMKDANTGKLTGINVDVMKAVADFLQLKVEWTTETGAGNYIEDLNNNRFDLMCASVWPDAGRTKNSLMTQPTLYSGVYMIVRADEKRFTTPQDMNSAGVTLTGIDGDVTATTIANDFPQAKPLLLPSSADASNLLENVATGKADGTFGDLGFFNDYNAKNPGRLKVLAYDKPVRVAGEDLGMKKGEFAFKAMLDTAITELGNSGKIADLVAKYKGGSMTPPRKTYLEQ